MKFRYVMLPAVLMVAACEQAPVAPSARADAPFALNASNSSGQLPPVSQAILDHVREELRKEPEVVDFLLDPDQAVALQVAVKDDGTRRWGLAEYFCGRLKDWGIDSERYSVRIVDAAKVAASEGDFRSISLGTINCKSQSRLD